MEGKSRIETWDGQAIKNGLVCNSWECERRVDRGAVVSARQECCTECLRWKQQLREWMGRQNKGQPNNGQRSQMDKTIQSGALQTDMDAEGRSVGWGGGHKRRDQEKEMDAGRRGISDTWFGARHQRWTGKRVQGKLGIDR